MVRKIIAYDFAAFHIEDYCLNFIDCCCRRLGCRVDRTNMLVELAGRTIQIKALPIGIPFERFVQLSEKAPVFLNMPDDVKVILGVDRLDYTKGIIIIVKQKFIITNSTNVLSIIILYYILYQYIQYQ